MTGIFLLLSLVGLLTVLALGGPWLLKNSAPTLSATPRIGAFLVSSISLLWIAAFIAVGPVMAWMSAGPTLLPAPAAQVCTRCLNAATPFSGQTVTLPIPALVPLLISGSVIAAVVLGVVREFRITARSQSSLAAEIRGSSETKFLLGYRVQLTEDSAVQAFSLPVRCGGIVVSRKTINQLSTDELAAVLAHEQAHVFQRHHLILTLLFGTTHWFRWVPLITAVRENALLFFEVAADKAAQCEVGTAPLASALLKLGQPVGFGAGVTPYAALHVAGAQRIRQLVGCPRSPLSVWLTGFLGLYAAALVGAVFVIHWPYLFAFFTGC